MCLDFIHDILFLIGDMLADRIYGCLFIAVSQGHDQHLMLSNQYLPAFLQLDMLDSEAVHLAHHLIQQLKKLIIVGNLIDQLMEFFIQLCDPYDIIAAASAGIYELLIDFFQLFQILIFDAAAGQPDRQFFQGCTDLKYIDQVFFRNCSNPGAFVRSHDYKTFQFQHMDCFPHRSTADTQLMSQRKFHEVLSGY